MGKIHGKDVYVSIDGDDISEYANNLEYGRTGDSHDVTCFGADGHEFQGGLTNGTATLTGIYDDTAGVGPAAAFPPLLTTLVPIVYRPTGVGTGKREDQFTALVTAYNETAPVADMITWTAELQISGSVNTITQA
jgi:hypothetical protein